MLKRFLLGAVVGFAFGSSKQGLEIRQRLDDLLAGLLSERDEEEGSSQRQEPIESRFGRENRRNGRKERSRDGNAAKSGDSDSGKPAESGVPIDKAVELAETLNAKPTTPPTDELEPGAHAIGA